MTYNGWMKRYLLLLPLCIGYTTLYAQNDSAINTKKSDTTVHPLYEVVVHAYEQNTSLQKTAAAISVINNNQLSEYNNTSILPAVNTAPGVRMEERSPGSYRFGIRGSSLESPFGVRNVKIYYNDIPYTDPGGNTYLNQLGLYNFQSIEIIKGPGSSLYGSGTGGVMLIGSMPENWKNGITLNYTGGSYALSSSEAELRIGDSSFHNVLRYQHLESNGYRQQSATHKDVISWDAVKHSNKSELSAHFFYGDLYYQTPGALTLAQYDANPAEARPSTSTIPGAVDSKAAIYQKTFIAGFTYKQQLSSHWSNATTLYGVYSQQLNPNIRNYSRTSEPNFGGRTVFKYDVPIGNTNLQWITGAEAQQGLTQDRTYSNINGNPQNLQTDQEINNRLLSGFTQLSWQVHQWIFTASASINQLNVQLSTISSGPDTIQNKTFTNQVAPRMAVLNRITQNLSLYAAVERGFSPPTTTELAPTGSQVNFDLAPEQGWNYEVGLRGFALKQRLYYDVNIFYFALQNAIVERRDTAGGDYYTNAGSTKQGGVELYLNYTLYKSAQAFIPECSIYGSYTGDYFHYDKFVQLDNDYANKQMPGTAPNTIAAGIDIHSHLGVYVNINYFYSDKIAMNDANTEYAKAYSLLGVKLGWEKNFNKYSVNVFAGVDNLLNETYSLGNDINAAAGRYYNAAPGINYYAGLSLGYAK